MGNASQAGAQSGESGVGNFTVYADFNCPFCYALNERLHAMDLEDQVEFRSIQHAPSVSSKQTGFKVLSELVTEIAEVRRKAPSIRINVPMFRPNSAAASALVSAVNKSEPAKASQLRRRIYRALWVDGQDISDTGLLATLLNELGIKPPADGALQDDNQAKWQSEWLSTLTQHNDSG